MNNEQQLIHKFLALAATDILLTLIEEQQLTDDDTQEFLQMFFAESQIKLKSDARIEKIALWLVEHGYASITEEFKQRLDKFIVAELKPQFENEQELAIVIDEFYAQN